MRLRGAPVSRSLSVGRGHDPADPVRCLPGEKQRHRLPITASLRGRSPWQSVLLQPPPHRKKDGLPRRFAPRNDGGRRYLNPLTSKGSCPPYRQKMPLIVRSGAFRCSGEKNYFFRDSSTATATETVMPTMGLLPVWELLEIASKLCRAHRVIVKSL